MMMVVLNKDSSTTKQQKYVLINASKMLYRYFIYFIYSTGTNKFWLCSSQNTKNRFAIHTTYRYAHRMYWYLVLLPGTLQHAQEDARLPAHNVCLYIYVCNVISVIVLSFVQKIIAEFTYTTGIIVGHTSNTVCMCAQEYIAVLALYYRY